MRIVILTSSRRGTASYCLPVLLKNTDAEIVQVIYSRGLVRKKKDFYRRKLKKMFRIGLPGALNGIRMRKWFHITAVEGKPIEDIGELCTGEGIPFAETDMINSAETIRLMQDCRAHLGLSLGNSYIGSKVFTIPQYGMLNIHGEILPAFQNAQSVIWQLYEGSPLTGYTIHQVDKKIDTGNIIKQESFPILFQDTLGDTVNRSCTEILRRSALGLADVINHFEAYLQAGKPQGKGNTYTTPSYRQYLRIVANFKRLKKQVCAE